MKIVRKPKKRPPGKLNVEDIEEATSPNGTIDLSKIRASKEKRKAQRSKMMSQAQQLLKEKKRISKHFTRAYSDIFGGRYILRSERYRKTKIQGTNDYKATKINSDWERLWGLLSYMRVSYDATEQEYADYIMYALELMIDSNIKNKNAVVGFVCKEGIVDDFFFKCRGKSFHGKKANDTRRRVDNHKEIFDNE